jgi:hypothetical protein
MRFAYERSLTFNPLSLRIMTVAINDFRIKHLEGCLLMIFRSQKYHRGFSVVNVLLYKPTPYGLAQELCSQFFRGMIIHFVKSP